MLQSCNDSDVEGADSMALVTILNPGGLSGTFYFKADNGQTLYPSQFAVPTGGYNPEDGQRAFIYYSLLEEKSQQYDYNIKLYGISEILTKDVEEMNESNEDEFGDEPIELVKLSGEDKFDCLISAGYFTCSFQIKVTGSEKHKISLDSKRFGGRYRRPRLHAARTAPQTRRHGIQDTPVARSSMASFKLNSYDPAVTQKKGLKIRYKDFERESAYGADRLHGIDTSHLN